MPQKKTKRSTFRFIVDVTPDRDMGLDDPDKVKDLIEEAIRDSGMDNGAKVSVSPPFVIREYE